MDNIFTYDRKIRITERFHNITTSLGISFFLTSIISITISVQKVDAIPAMPNIVFLLIIFVTLALLMLIPLPFTWNMVVISSTRVTFSLLSGRTSFKWSEIRSLTLIYKSRILDPKNENKGRARSITIKVIPVEGEHQRMNIRIIPKFRYAFREKAEANITFKDKIVNSIAFAPDEIMGPDQFDDDYLYSWDIRPKTEQKYSHF
ncbi:MAG: hypothetical protein HZR80_00735 [Candidatus Heimdallarchaeota archaeon]